MLELFSDYEKNTIVECALAIHGIEKGTVSQENLANFYLEDDRHYTDDITVLDNWNDVESLEFAGYTAMKSMVRLQFPDVDEAYLPFLVRDLLKEVTCLKEGAK